MKKIAVFLSVVLATLVNFPVFAGEATVKWQEPAKFTDIDPAEEQKDKFEATLFKDFDNIFAELAQRLPDNYRWQVTITDLDLAGDARPTIGGAGRKMREIKPNYPPSITFEYKLFDAQNNLLKQDKVDLKDLNFMSRPAAVIGLRTKPFPYEEYMISQWFDQQQNQKIFPSK
jgi:hypothetical protein